MNLESSIAARLGKTSAIRSINIARTVYANNLRERLNKKFKKILPPDSRIKTIQYQQQKSVDTDS